MVLVTVEEIISADERRLHEIVIEDPSCIKDGLCGAQIQDQN